MIVMEMLSATYDFGIYGGRDIDLNKSIFIVISKKPAAKFIGKSPISAFILHATLGCMSREDDKLDHFEEVEVITVFSSMNLQKNC